MYSDPRIHEREIGTGSLKMSPTRRSVPQVRNRGWGCSVAPVTCDDFDLVVSSETNATISR